MEYSLYELLCIFITYSFIGWCTEVIYAATVKGTYVNRGFNTGPVCPIYGFGMLLIVVFLERIKEHWALLFMASVIFTSVLEYLVGFILEKFFHEKWWDYTDEPLNINGYICLKFSLLWGLACVFILNIVHPTVMNFIRFIPQWLGSVVLVLAYASFITDFSITLTNILKIRKNLRAIDEIEDRLAALSESIGTNLSDTTLAVMEKGEKFKETLSEQEHKAEKFKDSISEKMPKIEDVKDSFAEKREEAEELKKKLTESIDAIRRSSKHLRNAFPNIGKGKYKNIFKK